MQAQRVDPIIRNELLNMDSLLRIYSDRKYLRSGEQYAQVLIPFWGVPALEVGKPTSGRYDELAAKGVHLFELVSLKECDVAVFPGETGNWDEMRTFAHTLIAEAAEAQKTVVLFFISDSAEPLDVGDSIVFRTSLYKSLRSPREYAMPAWSEDFVDKYWDSRLPIREKGRRPVVGFCGQPGPFTMGRKCSALGSNVKSYVSSCFSSVAQARYSAQKKRDGPFRGLAPSSARTKALARLLRATRVETKFRFKKGHFGGSLDRNGNLRMDVARQARTDLLENLIESDYIVCARGGGNFSYRLYETLSAGRIPVFVDTDCVLPFQEILPWKEFCVWVDENDIDRIEECILDFHSSLSPTAFLELQHRCRQVWKDWLSPLGFFSNMRAYLRKIKD